jgi:hypothetical protein
VAEDFSRFVSKAPGLGPCHLAGSSLRASCPPLSRRKLRFAILALLSFRCRSIDMDQPLTRYVLIRTLTGIGNQERPRSRVAPAGCRVVGDRTLGVLSADPKRPGARDGLGRVNRPGRKPGGRRQNPWRSVRRPQATGGQGWPRSRESRNILLSFSSPLSLPHQHRSVGPGVRRTWSAAFPE